MEAIAKLSWKSDEGFVEVNSLDEALLKWKGAKLGTLPAPRFGS